MKIVILSNAHLDCNTGIHIVSLAIALSEIYIKCVICVPGPEDMPKAAYEASYSVINSEMLLQNIVDDCPDLIYVWTPREGNRKTLARILDRFTIPYFVHFEDNEFHLSQVAFSMNDGDFARWVAGDGQPIAVPNHLSDPTAIAGVVQNAAGVTALVDQLLQLVPNNASCLVFWPGYDETLEWGMAADVAYRREIGIHDDEFVVSYTGNLHSANAGEIRSLYLAIALLNRRGFKVRLVRTGVDHAPLTDHGEELLRKFSLELGFVSRFDLPRLLSISDVLVQPGCPDAFNIYRFPSKIPEFLASKRPVVLPECNIGAHIADGIEAIVLPSCNALAIACTLEKLLPDIERRKAIGEAGARFASEHLRWKLAAEKLKPFFKQSLSNTANR